MGLIDCAGRILLYVLDKTVLVMMKIPVNDRVLSLLHLPCFAFSRKIFHSWASLLDIVTAAFSSSVRADKE